MARYKYYRDSIAQCLSRWANPWDAWQQLETYRQRIWNLAASQHTSRPDSRRVLDLLGLNSGVELAALATEWPAMGVVRGSDGWTLDAPQFDVWALGQVSVLKRKCETAPARADATHGLF